jgi:hypothetical protein
LVAKGGTVLCTEFDQFHCSVRPGNMNAEKHILTYKTEHIFLFNKSAEGNKPLSQI